MKFLILNNTLNNTLNDINIDKPSPIKYIEKEQYITVNSIDRNWEKTSVWNTEYNENRYNFIVKFNTSNNSYANVPKLLKNIVSIELVNVNIPIDPIVIPFDTIQQPVEYGSALLYGSLKFIQEIQSKLS